MVVYFAGPLFTEAEQQWNANFVEKLEGPDLEVFLPQLECAACFLFSEPPWPCVYRTCIAGIHSANVVVAVLDGPDADSGTCFEVGYAKALGKTVIGIRTDDRPSQEKGVNAMLSQGCDSMIVGTSDEILSKLKEEFDLLKEGL